MEKHLFLVSYCVCVWGGSGLGQLSFEICINLSTFGVPVLCYEHGFYVPTHLRRHLILCVRCPGPYAAASSTRQPVVDLHSEESQLSGRVVYEHCPYCLSSYIAYHLIGA